MVAGLTDGCDMRCQRQLAVDDDAKVASRFGDSDARAEHQDFLSRDLVEQRTQAEPHQLCLCRVQLQSIHAQPCVNIHDTCGDVVTVDDTTLTLSLPCPPDISGGGNK